MKLTAMPQLIPQTELNMQYVEKWKRKALSAYKHKALTPRRLRSTNLPLYHAKIGAGGVYFVMNKDELVYMYAYTMTTIPVHGAPNKVAAEALAYVFDDEGSGLMKEVFFDHLLHDLRFVVTDYIYTPKGRTWFVAQYRTAFLEGHRIYVTGLTDDFELMEADRDVFVALSRAYWGSADDFQKYRFAIEYRS